MKRIVALAAALLLCAGFGTASASQVVSAQSEALDLSGLQEAAGGVLPDADIETGISLDEGIATILDTGSEQLPGVFRKALRSGVLLLAVVLLCALAEGLYAGSGGSQAVDVISVVGALAITALAAADTHSLLSLIHI